MKIAGGTHSRLAAVVALGLAMGLGPLQGDAALSDEQSRGKRIYLEGTNRSGGDITAIVGSEGVRLPASAVPCASCHGPDGRGRPEGGVLPPDIRWSSLTKFYGHVHEDGRRHPAFDEVSLAHILRTGLDPASNRLDEAMPTYQMSDQDMADLVAYLKRLETDLDPGVEPNRIQVATLLPLQGKQGGLGQAMAQVMHAYFEDLNGQGGIFGRRLELLAIPYGASAEATLGNLRLALEREDAFALVGAYTVGLDEEVLELLREENMPLIGPFTLDPGDEIVNTAAFYLYPGFAEQARALADLAMKETRAEAGSLIVVGPSGKRVDRLVEAVQDQLRGQGAGEPLVIRYASGDMEPGMLAERVPAKTGNGLFFFGDRAELDALLGALATREELPRVYLLSALVSRPLFDAPQGFHQRIYVAYPTLASDITARGLSEYQALSQRHALPRDHLQGQIAAYAAAKLLVEGLRRAGRDLNRHNLVEALEELYGYETGLTPPLSYGPNRRIGARGAHLITVDLVTKSYQPVGGWHEVR